MINQPGRHATLS